MKTIINLIIITFLIGCDSHLHPPKDNSDFKNIIGKPIGISQGEVEYFDKSKTLTSQILIAEYPFPELMTYPESKIACEKLGDGWRIPNKEELEIIYRYYKNGVLKKLNPESYWTSTRIEPNHFGCSSCVYTKSFWDGSFSILQFNCCHEAHLIAIKAALPKTPNSIPQNKFSEETVVPLPSGVPIATSVEKP